MKNFKNFSRIYLGITVLVFLVIGFVGALTGASHLNYSGDGSGMSGLRYERGIYAIDVDYTSDVYGIINIAPQGDMDMWGGACVNTLMPDYSNHVTSYIYVNQAGTSYDISIYPVQESTAFNLSHVKVQRKSLLSATYLGLKVVGYLLLIYLAIAMVYASRKQSENPNKRYFIVGVALLTFVSMIGFMQNYVPGGQDAEFHLVRIASLAEGFRSGSFPVRMYSTFANDYGYPLGVLYGDLFLYPSAVLHMLGMPLWMSYVFYVGLISLLTVVISSYSFSKMVSDANVGFIGSMIYTLSVWRLNDVYIRGAAGEYAAMAFLPLIMLGFYKLVRDKEDGRKTFIYLVVGYFGVIQTHMLTTILVTVLMVVVSLFLWKRVFTVPKILLVLKAAGIALLTNLSFIVPMLDYYGTYDLSVEHQSTNIQNHGAYLSQLFSVTGNFNGGSEPLTDSIGIAGEMPLGIGLSMMVILAVLLFVMLADPKNKYNQALGVFGGVALVSIWMSTCYFPYDFISRRLGFLASIIGRVQFPWRYSVITTLVLSMAGVFLLKYFKERKVTYYAVACGVMFILTVGQAVSFISTKVTTNDYYINALNADQIVAPMIDNDTLYWFNGMSRDDLVSRTVTTSDESVTGVVTRINTPALDISFTNASGQEAWVEPPVLAYKGYHAYSGGQ